MNKKRNAEADELRAQLAATSARAAAAEGEAQSRASATEAQITQLMEKNRCAEQSECNRGAGGAADGEE